MGLLDVLNGMQHGPRGQTTPAQSGGMSPITMAILGLLAYKAIKSFCGSQTPSGVAPSNLGPAAPRSGPAGGSLGDLLRNGLGGLLAGGAAGGVLSGGLNDLLKQFQQKGLGGVANSWVGSGPNQAISASDLAGALDPEQIDLLAKHTGLSRDELLQILSQHLPAAIDKLTPHGRPPTADEVAHAL
jgi:uncharacterized protein YidB (DUF937 family)